MSAMTDLLGEHCDLSEADVVWLQRLVGDWQTLADLAYTDLLLVVPTRSPGFIAVALCRPSTAATRYPTDPVGTLGSVADHPELVAVMTGTTVSYRQVDWPVAGRSTTVRAFPVVRSGRVVAVLTCPVPDLSEPLSPLESNYLRSADDLLGMIGEGAYPDLSAPTSGRRGSPRAGDGLIRLDADGLVTFATPNALSCLHRLGYLGGLDGLLLAEVITSLLDGSEPVDEVLPLVVTGRASMFATVTSRRDVAVALRAIPLSRAHTRVGAVVLCRDVTELTRGERELMSKEATIREIHHRVKNNLQTVSALLRMQGRRMSSPQARQALAEAERRVATIAMVHETLLVGLDETVDLDTLLGKSLSLITPLVRAEAGAPTLRRTGSGGRVDAKTANALALVLTELVANALEHAGSPDRPPTVTIDITRDGPQLTIRVADDGPGLPARFQPGAAGLGTGIVNALVQGELGGQISWDSAPSGGAVMTVSCQVRGRALGRDGASV